MGINHFALIGLNASLILGIGSTPALAADPKKHVEPSLICETIALKPGTTAWIGINFKIEKEWHVYWNGLNDTGFPIEVKFAAPPGYKVGEWRWPAPVRHLAPGDELDHIYENSVTLAAPVEVPADASGTADFSAKLSWLVCSKACVPEEGAVSLSMPVATKDASVENSPTNRKAFEEARVRWPKPLAEAGTQSPKFDWQGPTVTVSLPSATQLAFFPDTDCSTIENLSKSTLASGNALKLQLQPDKGVEPVLRGILEVRSGPSTVAWYQLDQRPGMSGSPPTAPASPDSKSKRTN